MMLTAVAGAVGVFAPLQARAAVDWLTYGFDTQRSSDNPDETVLSPATVSGLIRSWSFDAGKNDATLTPPLAEATGQIGGQPLYISNVTIGGLAENLILFGDGNGVVYALSVSPTTPAGNIIWYQSVGYITVAHGTSTKQIGIRSALTVDRTANGGRGAVYVPLNGVVHALDLPTGAELAGWPISVLEPNPPQTDGAVHDAANVSNGQLYIGTAGYDDDYPPYFGRITSINTATAAVSGTWFPLSGGATMPTVSGGGVWGWGGVAIDPSASVGGVYVATGNSKGGNGQLAYAENIVNLAPDLVMVGAATPAFGKTQNGYDNDYGSTPTLFQPNGCGQKYLAAESKTGQLVIDSVAADGTLSVAQSLLVSAGDGSFIGTVAWDPDDQLLLLTSREAGPAPYQAGLIALQVSAGCGTPLFSLAWQTGEVTGTGIPVGVGLSSPTYANGLAYLGAGGSKSNAFAVATGSGSSYVPGQILWTSASMSGVANITPTVVNGQLFVGTQAPGHSVFAYKLPSK